MPRVSEPMVTVTRFTLAAARDAAGLVVAFVQDRLIRPGIPSCVTRRCVVPGTGASAIRAVSREDQTVKSTGHITSITLACPDPQPLSEFYRAVTGWEVIYSGDDAVYLAGPHEVRLGFERVAGFAAPLWERRIQPALRLDLAVDDIGEAERQLVGLGATRPGHDLDNESWIFLADPVGHPLCLTTIS